MKIHIVSFKGNIPRWEDDLARRLVSAGHEVLIDYRGAAPPAPLLKAILALEGYRFGPVVKSGSFTSTISSDTKPDVIVDLTGTLKPGQVPILAVEVGGSRSFSEGLLRLRSSRDPIDLVMFCDGKPMARARAMLQDQVWLSRDIAELLVAIQSLYVLSLARVQAGLVEEVAVSPSLQTFQNPGAAYLKRLVGGLAARAMKKLMPGKRDFSWSTAYRFIDGPGVSESRRVDDASFTVLEDDGQRFYADPFPIEHEGRCYLFVEEYPYALGRGVISVTECNANGRFDRPRVVLEEAHHLSYPNVFPHDGEFFMIPESGAANEVVLYRARRFPDDWVREAVLVEGRSLADVTLFTHQGRLWMFAAERFAGGNASDTMAVYSAEHLRGPWTAHPLNPVTIDRAGARPGGRVVQVDGRSFLPVQDGTEAYGGGLGLREILHLDAEDLRLGPVLPILDAAGTAPASLHTLNRSGRLEVIDQRGV